MQPQRKQQNPWDRSGNRGGGGGPPPPRGPHWKRLAIIVLVVIVVIYFASSIAPASGGGFGGPNLLYLVMLLAFVGTGTVLWSRLSGREFARNVLVWVGLLAVATGIGAFWEDMGFGSKIGGRLVPGLVVEENGEYWVQRRSDGHFWVLADVNGVRVPFLVDTGATEVALSRADAERAGITVGPGDYVGIVNTANGTTTVAPVRIDEIAVGPVIVRGVPGHVSSGGMEQSLLGMSFLNALSGYAVEGDRLYLNP